MSQTVRSDDKLSKKVGRICDFKSKEDIFKELQYEMRSQWSFSI